MSYYKNCFYYLKKKMFCYIGIRVGITYSNFIVKKKPSVKHDLVFRYTYYYVTAMPTIQSI